VSGLMQDVKYAARALFKSKTFTAVAVLALSIGIGANAAIFSVVNAVVLQPLPYTQPDRLVTVSEGSAATSPAAALGQAESYPLLRDWQRDSRSFAALSGYQYVSMTLTGHGAATAVPGAIVASEFFTTFQAAPLTGRVLEPQDHVKGAGRVAVISERMWRTLLGADPAVVGAPLHLDAKAFTIVGVMPAGFAFPDQTPSGDFWIPVEQSPEYAPVIDRSDSAFLIVIGRLAPHVTSAQATSDLTGLISAASSRGHLDQTHVARIAGLQELVAGNLRPALLILLAAVCLLVLVACANLASMLLARASSRAREIAIRVALGAGRRRVFRQLLTESVLLALIGGAAGLLLAYWAVAAIGVFARSELPHLRPVSIDRWVLLFTCAVSVVSGLLFGLAPAWHSSEFEFGDVLRQSGRGTIGTSRQARTRNVLVAGEVALAVGLLIGSGLLLRSFYRLTHADVGFDPRNVLTTRVSLPQTQYINPDQWTRFFRTAVEQLNALPGVEGSAAALPIPFTGSTPEFTFTVAGAAPSQGDEPPTAAVHTVSADYFRVLRIPVASGRDFTGSDMTPHAEPVVVIGESLARHYFNSSDPVGRHVSIAGSTTSYRIVGVVGDVKDATLGRTPPPALYLPYTTDPWWTMAFVVRTKTNPAALASAVKASIERMDPSLAVDDVRPYADLLADSAGTARFRTTLLGIFGALALGLAALGIYGVLACLVSQRTHEIGVRIALGAKPSDVLRLVMGQGMLAVIIGTAAGLMLAVLSSRVLTQFLYGVGQRDPAVYAGAAAIVLGVALMTCYVHARRAMNLDPLVALRTDGAAPQ
jgi:putative ABC transport system permease protein